MSNTQQDASGKTVRVDGEQHGCVTIKPTPQEKPGKAAGKTTNEGDKA